MERVLFVCTANICRSPMAASIFNGLAEDEGMTFRAESAGVAALVGDPMAPHAITALGEAGFRPQAHSARQVNGTMIEGAKLVLAMSPQHVETLRESYEGASIKTYALPEYATDTPARDGVTDPYGYPLSAYRKSVRLLYEYVERTIKKLDR